MSDELPSRRPARPGPDPAWESEDPWEGIADEDPPPGAGAPADDPWDAAADPWTEGPQDPAPAAGDCQIAIFRHLGSVFRL